MSLPNKNAKWDSWSPYDCPNCGRQLKYWISHGNPFDLGDYGGTGQRKETVV